MPATSESQRKAAGAALAVKRGKRPKSSLRGASLQMLSMSEAKLREFARRPQKKRRKKRTARKR